MNREERLQNSKRRALSSKKTNVNGEKYAAHHRFQEGLAGKEKI